MNRGQPVGLFLLDSLKEKLDFDTFITAYCYENRIIKSTERAVRHFNFKRAITFVYDGEAYLDSPTVSKWKRNMEKMDALIKASHIKIEQLPCKHDSVVGLSERLEKLITKNERVLIDITGFTKNYILKLCQSFDLSNSLFIYTKSKHRIPSDEELSTSILRIEPLDGFEGFTRVDRKDLIVLILGYEGNRALGFLRKFETEPIYALIGIPFEDEGTNTRYIDSVTRANNKLLYTHRVALCEKYVHSLDPFRFVKDLQDAVNNFPGIENYNICISCLGTKLQTLGLYLYWEKTNCQILYSIPNRRFDITSDVGESWLIKLR